MKKYFWRQISTQRTMKTLWKLALEEATVNLCFVMQWKPLPNALSLVADAKNANGNENTSTIHSTFPFGPLWPWIWHIRNVKFELSRMMQGVIKSALLPLTVGVTAHTVGKDPAAKNTLSIKTLSNLEFIFLCVQTLDLSCCYLLYTTPVSKRSESNALCGWTTMFTEIPQRLTDRCTRHSWIFCEFFKQTLVQLILMSAVSYFSLCSFLFSFLSVEMPVGHATSSKGEMEITDFIASQNNLLGLMIWERFSNQRGRDREEEGCWWWYRLCESSHDWKAATPVAGWKNLPSSFMEEPKQSRSPQTELQRRVTFETRSQAESEQHDDTFHRWLQDASKAKTHTCSPLGRISDAVITGYRQNLLLGGRDDTSLELAAPPCVHIKNKGEFFFTGLVPYCLWLLPLNTIFALVPISIRV